ncbi:MAG: FTR1 family iron permease [Helicobacteraceae bacterium]|jgi:high-affinity iron transporter|nr:FTR1 family iron permease [Helicobacteraceae bacterium]
MPSFFRFIAAVAIIGATLAPSAYAQTNAPLPNEVKEGIQTALNAACDRYEAGDPEGTIKSVGEAKALLPVDRVEDMERHFEDMLYIINEGEDPANARTQNAAIMKMLIGSDDSKKKRYASWSEIVADMDAVLRSAHEAYLAKEPQKAKDLINNAYFGFYEKYGVERATLSSISGKRASVVEYQFSTIKNAINSDDDAEVKRQIDELIVWLHEDAKALDEREISGFSSFLLALSIMLREGVEAILVIAAIIAYLVRSGNARYTKEVYIGSIAALAASAAMAYVISKILLSEGGAPQEIVEGAAMLTAVVVLFFVSNWMISKSSEESWKGYIEGKVKSAISRGSVFALAAAAFLAVFREGAETILFFQALFIEAEAYSDMVWLGFGVGCVALVFIFAAIRFGSLRLPLKPFFIGTSVLMYILCVAFAGGGVKELQEADVVSVTSLPYVPTIDLLGVYPTVETIAPQIALLILAALSFVYYRKKARIA